MPNCTYLNCLHLEFLQAIYELINKRLVRISFQQINYRVSTTHIVINNAVSSSSLGKLLLSRISREQLSSFVITDTGWSVPEGNTHGT